MQGSAQGGVDAMVLGQPLSDRDQAALLALLRLEDDLHAFGAGEGVDGLFPCEEVEVDDPFGSMVEILTHLKERGGGRVRMLALYAEGGTWAAALCPGRPRRCQGWAP